MAAKKTYTNIETDFSIYGQRKQIPGEIEHMLRNVMEHANTYARLVAKNYVITASNHAIRWHGMGRRPHLRTVSASTTLSWSRNGVENRAYVRMECYGFESGNDLSVLVAWTVGHGVILKGILVYPYSAFCEEVLRSLFMLIVSNIDARQ